MRPRRPTTGLAAHSAFHDALPVALPWSRIGRFSAVKEPRDEDPPAFGCRWTDVAVAVTAGDDADRAQRGGQRRFDQDAAGAGDQRDAYRVRLRQQRLDRRPAGGLGAAPDELPG